MPACSSMLKLVKEIGSVLLVNSPAYIFTYHPLALLPLLFKKDHPPLSMGSSPFYGKWVIGSRNGREVDTSPALQPFFLLGNQVA